MKLKSLLLLACCAATVAGAQPNPGPFDFPFEPASHIEDAVLSAPTWVEVRLLDPSAVDAALALLAESAVPPPLLALAADGRFHAGIGGSPVALPLATQGVSRAGAPVEYKDDCSVVPVYGDELAMSFGLPDAGPRVLLQGRLVDQLYLKTENEITGALVEADVPSPTACTDFAQSRLYFLGTLTYRPSAGATLTTPVIIQSTAAL